MHHSVFTAPLALLAALAGAPAAADTDCVPAGAWVEPGGGPLTGAAVLARGGESAVVLLGEHHDSAEHHRWQLHTLAALHARRPDLVLALEMFPRRVQPALDAWVAGELDEAAFIEASDWREVWNFDPALYMPLFHFARMHRIPMVAVNVDAARLAESGEGDGGPLAVSLGLGQPAEPLPAYLDMLRQSWAQHIPSADGAKPAAPAPDAADPYWQRFVEVQLLWDRAMAEGMVEAREAHDGALVVGVLGGGHVINGWGVEHQLADVGETRVLSLLPWDAGRDCAGLTPGLVDAVFGLSAPAEPPSARPALGVWLEPAESGVRILDVVEDSVAAQTGLQAGDVLTRVAGVPARSPAEVSAIVQRQAPGTWLPLELQREGRALERVARFPPAAGAAAPATPGHPAP